MLKPPKELLDKNIPIELFYILFEVYMAWASAGELSVDESVHRNLFDWLLWALHDIKSWGECQHWCVSEPSNDGRYYARYRVHTEEWREGTKKEIERQLSEAKIRLLEFLN